MRQKQGNLLYKMLKLLHKGAAHMHHWWNIHKALRKLDKLSDHEPQISSDGFTMIWNVLKRCRKRPKGYNNGFGIIETEKEYIARCKVLAQKIAQILDDHPLLSILLLQEMPTEALAIKAFWQQLDNYGYRHLDNIFSISKGEFTTILKLSGQEKLREILPNSGEYRTMARLKQELTEEIIVNVHFKFGTELTPILEFLQKMQQLYPESKITIGGDFNRHMLSDFATCDLSQLNYNVASAGAGNISLGQRESSGKIHLLSTDAILKTQQNDLQAKFLSQYNCVSSKPLGKSMSEVANLINKN